MGVFHFKVYAQVCMQQVIALLIGWMAPLASGHWVAIALQPRGLSRLQCLSIHTLLFWPNCLPD